MLAFYITSESKLAYRLDNGATAINFTESTETLNLNSWDYVAVVSTYSQSNGDTTVDLIVNSLTYYTQTHPDTYMIEEYGSLTSVGQQYEYNAGLQASRFFNGFIYTLWVYNAGSSPETLQAQVIDNSDSNQSCTGGCTYCPIDSENVGTCISDCALGKFDDACKTCPTGCSDNCVREEDYCELCINPLCDKCETFIEQTCFECATNAELNGDGNDCECIDGYNLNATGMQCQECGLSCEDCSISGTNTYNECNACQGGYYNISRDGTVYCSPYCPTGYTAGDGDICTPPSDPAAILSYTFIDSFDTYVNDIAGINNNAEVVNEAGSGLPATHRGLYFNGSGGAKVQWADDFVLGLQFSVHSWVYAFDQVTRSSDMTLFSKSASVGDTQTWYDHLALRVDTALNFKVTLGYDTSAQEYTSLTSISDALAENTWTYVTYYLYMTNSNQVQLQIYINSSQSGSTDTMTTDRILLFDNPDYEPWAGAEYLQAQSPFNQWNGYIYDLHIFQALGDMQYKTDGCNDDCVHCPMNNDCLWAVDFDSYDNGTCESTCENIGCRRDGRCQSCTFQHCHMCADYYCESCSDHSSDSCSSCLSAAVSGANGSCECGNDIWGKQYTRTDFEKPCCASGCSTCTEEVEYAYCSACDSSLYEQPALTADQSLFKVCFDECPTGFTASEGPPKTCQGQVTRIIEYDLTYIDRDFKNLAIDGQNDGKGASFIGSAFDDTQPYKLRGAYSNGSSQGVFIPSLNLHHSFTMTFWAMLTGTNDRERVLFSKDKGGDYSTANAENFLDLAVLDNGRMGAFLYQNSTDAFSGSCETVQSYITSNDWYFIGYSFDFNGKDTRVHISLDGSEILTHTGENIYMQDKSSYSQAWLFMSTASSFGAAAPSNAWEGFIYWFALDQTVLTISEIMQDVETDGELCSSDILTCSVCPKVRSKCLWTVERDSYVDSLGNVGQCDEASSHEEPLCTNDVGCVRGEDCNLCNDRLCSVCINFDEGAAICEQCKSNSSNGDGSQACECLTQFFFDEVSDSCESCHVACDECADFGDNTNKSCTACASGYFLHPDSHTCLDFCPTGFTENGIVCDRDSNTMLNLSLTTWEQDFKIIYDGTIPIIRGSDADYDSADPWLYNSLDNQRMFYFDGVDDCMYIPEETTDINYLRLFHTMTIQVWVYLESTGIVQTLFSKTDKTASSGEEQKIFLQWNGNLEFGFTESYDGASSVYSYGIGQLQTDEWFLGSVVITKTGNHSTDISILHNGTLQGQTTVAAQFSDLKGADTRIGCDLNAGANWTRHNLVKGYLYSLEIESVSLTTDSIVNDYGGLVAPSLGSCAYDAYDLDGVCSSCNGNCDEDAHSCTY